MTSTTLLSKTASFGAAVALVGVSMLIAPAAHAQTTASVMGTAQLQAEISALQAQLSTVQGGTVMTYPVSNSNGVSSVMGSPLFTRSLTVGSTGSDVSSLQSWLVSHGFSIPAGVSGYFGTQTRSAVMSFQASNGISSTGYVGPITLGKLNTLGGGSATTGGTVMMTGGTALPPGCAIGSLYSTTTGQLCSLHGASTTSSAFSSTSSLDSQMAAIAGLQSGLSNDLSQSTTASSQDDSGN